MSESRPTFDQSAVIPYRITPAGQVRVLLITSRSGKRWVLPKGLLEAGMTPWDSAAKEALEEAGVVGQVSKRSVGTYSYQKWGGRCVVKVYLLHVQKQLGDWEEKAIRQRQWESTTSAASLLDEPKLAAMVLRLPKIIKAG